MSGTHARLSASSAHRWLHCAGSVPDGQGKDSTSVYAAHGTFAHHIAAECLSDSNNRPADWLGNKTIVDGHEIECDQEMVDGIDVYLDAVLEKRFDEGLSWVEMPLLEALQKVDPDFGGTADFVTYSPSAKHLIVIDLKFGSGKFVSAIDNDQLKIYALGAMLACNELIHTVEVCIVQPRHEGGPPVRSETFNAVDILDYVADLQEAAEATRSPGANKMLAAGDWCRFCRFESTCAELEKQQHALVAAEFEVGMPYDADALAKALVSIPLVKGRIKALEEFAYAEASRGAEIPGFKLVDKRVTRKWAQDAGKTQAALFDMDLRDEDIYEVPELRSPAQVEKRLKEKAPRGKKKDAGDALKPFVNKVSSGTTLVQVADDRAPAKTVSIEDFSIVG